jgi:hypothetical protein
MARRADTAIGGTGGVKAVGALVVVIALTLVVLLLVRARPGLEPFDPRSGQPSGARGLVLTLDAAGADVTDSREVPDIERVDDTRVLVLDDRLDADQRSALIDFIDAGGVVVVADPDSSLHGGAGLDGGAIAVSADPQPGRLRTDAELEANIAPGRCDIAALQRLRGVFAADGVLFPVGPDEPACFTDPDGANPPDGRRSFVIVRQIGAGTVIGLGDNEPFINRDLRVADNAAVAVSLLVPEVGTQVTILVGTGAARSVQDVGSGDDTLVDLVPAWVWMTLVLAALSFVMFAASRSVRVGRILTEPLPTPIAGSELVSATGNLMQRAGHAPRAATLLRDRLHRDLCSAHGMATGAPVADLDRVVAQRTGSPPGQIEQVLGTEVRDEAGLLALVAAIHRIRATALTDTETDTDTASDGDRRSPNDTVPERATTP